MYWFNKKEDSKGEKKLETYRKQISKWQTLHSVISINYIK